MPLGTSRIYSFPELGSDAFHGLPGLLADSLPDRWGTEVFNLWLTSQGRPVGSYNPVERLMYIGVRGMGALEFHPARRGFGRSEIVSAESLADVASAVLAARGGIDVDLDGGGLETLLQVGTSAGGLRAKAIVAWNTETREMRSGQVQAPEGFEYWIIKFDGVGSSDGVFTDPSGYGRVEMAYYLMATVAGIDMSRSFLHVDGGGRAHFMTKRFDRLDDGSKIHTQTYQALTHRDYNDTGRHSWESALQTTTRLCGLGATEQLYRRMVF
jgi:serine/threonine-protein kinase HipA